MSVKAVHTTAPESSEEKLIEIRASGLPDHQDCPRKYAYKMAQDPRSGLLPVFLKHGFEIKKKNKNNIGAFLGILSHEPITDLWQALMDGYDLDVEQAAITKFRKKIKDGEPEYDTGKVKTTPDKETAEKQLVRMVKAYEPFARSIKVVQTEVRLHTRLDPLKPYMITGTPDCREDNGNIRDMKFGRNLVPYEAQVGAYRLMARSHGLDVGGLFIDHVKRSKLVDGRTKKPIPQPPPQHIPYDVETAENAAHYEINYVVEQIEKFIETGNPYAFPARPQSNLCSKKWCPAWGTPFCNLGRPEKEAV